MTDTAFFILLSNDKIVDVAMCKVQETHNGWEPVEPYRLDIPAGVDTLRLELPNVCLDTRIPGVRQINRVFAVGGHPKGQELPWRDC